MRLRFPAIVLLLVACMGAGAVPAPRPNFVIFLTDDQGWGDLGCYGHPRIRSPNLDRFATEGVRFTQAYAACGVCSPSRSAILTGRTPYRNGVWRWIPEGSDVHLRTNEVTVATLLRKGGYGTCHAGKWHLNGRFNSPEHPQPGDHGYDHWLATQNNAAPNHLNPVNFVRNGRAAGRIEGPSSRIVVDEAIRWLRERPDRSKPFFLTVWTHEPHQPIESAPEFMAPYADIADEGIRQHHGNITQMDHAFGVLMKALDDLGCAGNTFVVFTADNGPEGNGESGRTRGSTGGLRGRKRADFEGGIRVPGIVRFPSYFKEHGIRPGSVSDVPIVGHDLFTTVCTLAGVPIPADRTIDGANLLPALEGRPIERAQPLYWRTHIAPPECRVALRIDDWKIVGNADMTAFLLFNMRDDPRETTDLAATHPADFDRMKAALIRHDAAVMAEGPDWWKREEPAGREKPAKRPADRTAEDPKAGTDATGTMSLVAGGTLSRHELGFELKTDGEAVALHKLDEPIRGRAVFALRYRATAKTRTRNAALAFGDKPGNADLWKAGTAIGMGTHVVFHGGWANAGSGGRKAAFDPDKTFEALVEVDLVRRTCRLTVDGTTIDAKLPESLKEIAYYGYYVKGSSTAFSPVDVTRPAD